MLPEEILKYSEKLLALVPKDGSSIGNKSLQTKLKESFKKLSEEEFWEIRNNLIEEGKLLRGRGKGGSVYLPIEISVKKLEKEKKTREKDLYEPFYQTIAKSWVKDYKIKEGDFVIEKTASQGKKKTGGKWTRPDITLVYIKKYPYIPEKTFEVITFEIKPSIEDALTGVFETAAHSMFSHKSYLVFPYYEDVHSEERIELFARIQELCNEFGIGLLIFNDVNDYDTYEEKTEPKRKEPDPKNVSEFIIKQINDKNRQSITSMLQ